jgi:bifunctional UDP-N-acetylglucosamine pyrophosphorylase/glucosamine-1-phosphate N-acetyltransferase
MGEPALAEFDGDVVILPGDAPTIRASTLQKLLEFHRKEASTCTVLTTRLEDAAHYGRIVRDADGSVARIVEAKDATAEERTLKEINSGVYVVDARFLFAALRRVGNQNAQREYYLTDIVGLSRVDGLKPRAFLHLDSGELEGVNDRAELSRAESRLRLDANTALQKAGVTLVDPASTFVEPGCRVEADAWIDPQVQLRGKTCVEAGARVGTGTILRDVLVGAGAQLGPYCVLEAVSIAPGAVLPPFSGRISA